MAKGWKQESARHSLARKGIKTGQKGYRPNPKTNSKLEAEVKDLRADCVDYKAQDYDFSKGYAEKWEVGFEQTEEEMENEEWMPMMNYYYPLPKDFKPWDNIKKDLSPNTTLIYFTDEDKYAIALTGGGMNLTWNIAESYINLGYLPPLDYCDLPRMAGMRMKPKSKKIIFACRRTLDVTKNRAVLHESKLNEVEAWLKEGGAIKKVKIKKVKKGRQMRGLNKQQKTLLDNWYKKNKEKVGLRWDAQKLPYELYSQLEEMNDFETLHQETTNYITDKI